MTPNVLKVLSFSPSTERYDLLCSVQNLERSLQRFSILSQRSSTLIMFCNLLFILQLQATFALNDNWKAERLTNRGGLRQKNAIFVWIIWNSSLLILTLKYQKDIYCQSNLGWEKPLVQPMLKAGPANIGLFNALSNQAHLNIFVLKNKPLTPHTPQNTNKEETTTTTYN